MKTITLLQKRVYGTDVLYPVCDDAKRFAELVGAKTLTVRNLKIIKDLGYDIAITFDKVVI